MSEETTPSQQSQDDDDEAPKSPIPARASRWRKQERRQFGLPLTVCITVVALIGVTAFLLWPLLTGGATITIQPVSQQITMSSSISVLTDQSQAGEASRTGERPDAASHQHE